MHNSEDNNDEQLHANWRALATIHLPLKRFVAEGSSSRTDVAENVKIAQYKINGVSGEQAKQIYNEIINETTNNIKASKKAPSLQPSLPPPPAPAATHKVAFEQNAYFSYAMENNVGKLQELNYAAGDINVRDNYGWTALMVAACAGAKDAVKFLLRQGIERNAKDKAGNTALEFARINAHAHIVKLLQQETTLYQVEQETRAAAVAVQQVKHAPFYCEICQQTFTETSQAAHQTSTLHQFNVKPTCEANILNKFNISHKNRGLQLMLKQGWDKASGLGPTSNGRLYPVKTVIRKERTGLGIKQTAARVTHFAANDANATRNNKCNYYKSKPRNRNDIKREKQREWKRDRRLRKELS